MDQVVINEIKLIGRWHFGKKFTRENCIRIDSLTNEIRAAWCSSTNPFTFVPDGYDFLEYAIFDFIDEKRN